MTRKIKLLSGSAGAAVAILANASLVFAASNGIGPPNGYTILGNLTPQSVVSGIIQLLLTVAFVIAFLFLVFGGIRWILSGGDKTAAEGARGTLTAALIGLVIILAAWLIIFIIEQAFGIKIITNPVVVPPLY